MPFNDWYNVTVSKSGNRITSVNFADGENVAENWRVIHENMTYTENDFDSNGDGIPDHFDDNGIPETEHNWGGRSETQTTMRTTYYGENGPTEATSFINHVDETYDPDTDTGRQIWFDVVFGGTKAE